MKNVLLITSAQTDLLAEEGKAWPMVQATVRENQVPQKLARLLTAARKARVPVIHSPVAFEPSQSGTARGLDAFQRLILEARLLLAGEPGSAFVPQARPEGDDIVLPPRRGFSAFWAGSLKPRLQALGATHLTICGMLAEGCVTSHARDAAENGYHPIVISDAIASTSSDLLAASLLELKLHTDALLTTDAAIASWG